MDVKVDSTTVVPLGWVLSGFGLLLSGAFVVILWVSAVDYRLQRIEEKLGIPAYHAGNTESAEPNAYAK